MVASFRRPSSRNPFAFPGRAPQLNLRHPAAIGNRVLGQGLRLASVVCPNGGTGNNQAAMLDLATNTVSRWTTSVGGQIVNSDVGPSILPNVGNTTGIVWPALYTSEAQVYGMTWAVIVSYRNSTHGTGFVCSDGTTGGDKIEANSNTIRYVHGGSVIFNVGSQTWPLACVDGHAYFAAVSSRATGVAGFTNPRCSGILVDMITGQSWMGTTGIAMAGTTVAPSGQYSNCTYGASGTLDYSRLAAACLSMNYLTQEQLWAWAQDPWSLWYAPPHISSSRKVTVAGAGSVWSAADAAANSMTLTNGGLTVTATISPWHSIRGTTGQSSGKFYVEFFNSSAAVGPQQGFGLASSSFVPTSYPGSSNYSFATFSNPGAANQSSPSANITFAYVANASINANDTWAIAVDLTAGKYWLAENNVWFGSGNPATGANPMATIAGPALGQTYFPTLGLENGAAGGTWTIKPNAASQTYAPPAGFTAWDAPPPTGSVWSASDAAANSMTLSNGGSSIVYHGSSSWVSARGTVSKSSGKVYVEFKYGGGAGAQNFAMVGLASSGFDPTSYFGTSNYSGGYALPNFAYVSTGFASVDTPNLNVAAIGDVIGIAVDFTAQKIWYSYNNVWSIILERSGPRDPATGTFNNMTFVAATVGALFPTISLHGDGVNGGGTWTLQPNAASQTYAPPAGFSAWDGAGVTASTSRAAALMIGA